MSSLYLPRQFASDERALALTLLREHPLASLISTDDAGLPFVTHLPLVPQSEEPLVLLGHCAKANPHWRYLQRRAHALVTFMGPHAYLSPSVYPDLQRVPTWNYLVVHCQVQATLIEDEEGKDRLLKQLIAAHEPAYAAQWRSLAPAYTRNMLTAIVGFSLQVTDLQCKFKLNQHRPESHAAMARQYAAGGENARALLTWMQRLGLDTAAADAATEP